MNLTLLRNKEQSWDHVWFWNNDYWSTLDLSKNPYEIWLHFHLFDKISLTLSPGSKLVYFKLTIGHAYLEINQDFTFKLIHISDEAHKNNNIILFEELETPYLPIISLDTHLLSNLTGDFHISIWDFFGEAVDQNQTLAQFLTITLIENKLKYKKIRDYPIKAKLNLYHGITDRTFPIYYKLGTIFLNGNDLSQVQISDEEIKHTHRFHIYMEHVHSHLFCLTNDSGFLFLVMDQKGTMSVVFDDEFLIKNLETLTPYNFQIKTPEIKDGLLLPDFSSGWKHRFLKFARRHLTFESFCFKYPHAISSCLPYGTFTEVLF